jgi:hypothetical protein
MTFEDLAYFYNQLFYNHSSVSLLAEDYPPEYTERHGIRLANRPASSNRSSLRYGAPVSLYYEFDADALLAIYETYAPQRFAYLNAFVSEEYPVLGKDVRLSRAALSFDQFASAVCFQEELNYIAELDINEELASRLRYRAQTMFGLGERTIHIHANYYELRLINEMAQSHPGSSFIELARIYNMTFRAQPPAPFTIENGITVHHMGIRQSPIPATQAMAWSRYIDRSSRPAILSPEQLESLQALRNQRTGGNGGTVLVISIIAAVGALTLYINYLRDEQQARLID